MTITTKTIEIAVGDGSTMPAYLAQPADGKQAVAVVVAHELFGVNPDIRTVVDDLATAGHLTIAPEFYHRNAPPGHWLARDTEGRRAGFDHLHRLTRDQALADAAAAVDWLESQPGIERVAMVGFSAGGHLAYLAACRLPITGVAVLYGGWLPTTDIPLSQPTPTLELTPGILGRLLYLVGEDDALIDADQRTRISDALRQDRVDHEIITYPATEHAFFWPGTASYNQHARQDAWSRILALLATNPTAQRHR